MFMQDRARDVNAPISVLEALLILAKKLQPATLNDYTQANLAILLAYSQQGAAEGKITGNSTSEVIAEFLYQRVKSAPPTTFVWDSVPDFVAAGFQKIAGEQAAAAEKAAAAAAASAARVKKQRDKERQDKEDRDFKPGNRPVKDVAADNADSAARDKQTADAKELTRLKANIHSEVNSYQLGSPSGLLNYSGTAAGVEKLKEVAGDINAITTIAAAQQVLIAVRRRKGQLS